MSKTIQVRNVPEAIRRALKTRAAVLGMSLSAYLLSELHELAEQPTMLELQKKLATRSRVQLPDSAAVVIRQQRTSAPIGMNHDSSGGQAQIRLI